MNITVCVGCGSKESKEVIDTLEHLVSLHELTDKIDLDEASCLGVCTEGVSVKLDEEIYTITPSTTKDFFEEEVLSRSE
ncbi:MAG: hypothetical protein K0R15_279 [Clostridiales bacterium]|jgi:NADH:ubiquinone oxidoreductase subunit E|nr:hypothetical protein [Clostridiales bacterium]